MYISKQFFEIHLMLKNLSINYNIIVQIVQNILNNMIITLSF